MICGSGRIARPEFIPRFFTRKAVSRSTEVQEARSQLTGARERLVELGEPGCEWIVTNVFFGGS